MLFFVLPEPGYLWLGIILLGLGNVFFELASVNYNGLLSHLATKDRVGAVSGLGWGMGYLGDIVLLLILFVGFINPELTSSGGTVLLTAISLTRPGSRPARWATAAICSEIWRILFFRL